MSMLTTMLRIYPKRVASNALAVCKNCHTSTAEAHVEDLDKEPKKPTSRRMEEFRKKLEETTPEEVEEQVFRVVQAKNDPLPPWPNDTNPHTGEIGGPRGPEPTRYGDWERKGICVDF